MRGTAVATLGAATLVVIGWRMQLHSHAIANADHALHAPAFSAAFALLAHLCSDATDPVSWGLLWPLTLVAAAFMLFAPEIPRRSSRFLAGAWLAQMLLMFLALLLGPERVRIFALGGTLFNRMLIQLTPAATLVLLAFAHRILNRVDVLAPQRSPKSITPSQSSFV